MGDTAELKSRKKVIRKINQIQYSDTKNKSKLSEIETQLEKINLLFSAFDDVQFKLELANEGDEEERVEVEDSFCQAIAQAKEVEWESLNKGENLPTYDEFIAFLENRYRILETIEVNKASTPKPSNSFSRSNSKGDQYAFTTQESLCYFCKKAHAIYKCPSFLSLSVEERYKEIFKLKLCQNCLKPGHYKTNCQSNHCRKCSYKHNTLLHKIATDNSSANLTIQPLASSSDVSKAIAKTADTELSTEVSESNNSALYNNTSNTNMVLLSTAIIYVVDSNGVKHQCHALLDSAKVTLLLKLTLPFLVLSSICGQIPSSSFTVNFKVPDNIKLADPEFSKYELVLQETTLGWIVTGQLNLPNACYTTTKFKNVQCNLSLNQQIAKFWKLEEIPAQRRFSLEQFCESHFKETTKRDDTGRFIVKLLFKPICS
ncbi:hypothetical protein QE152_g33239 [Popillia japonica]|uniref:CCHC-type domain-containing protein n=1 Tax=Popillia japonica TaxID=7064 RepID=A0AAW1IX40_POPJA